jgi:integrase/recombinase XerD
MGAWVESHLEWLEAKGYARGTIQSRRGYLRKFVAWSAGQGATQPHDFALPLIEAYRVHLHTLRRRDGAPLGWGSRAQPLLAIRGLFRWLTLTGELSSNPAADVELPRRGRRLPRRVLSASEVERVLALPNIRTGTGLRDRTILEVLYWTGIRRAECANLDLRDLDLGRGVLLIRDGKGARDRFVPLGRRVTVWLTHYIRRGRTSLLKSGDPGALFLSRLGGQISVKRLGAMVHDALWAAGLGGGGACHRFRHTVATLMLEGGADIRDLQELLGHEQLNTTALYARVSIQRLQEVHRRTHPAW